MIRSEILTTEVNIIDSIREKYFLKFGITEKIRVFRSPGRINLIGEHTDYNNGFVLPASVDKAVYFAIAPREDDQVLLYAVDLDESYSFSLERSVET
jgi:galactokinase